MVTTTIYRPSIDTVFNICALSQDPISEPDVFGYIYRELLTNIDAGQVPPQLRVISSSEQLDSALVCICGYVKDNNVVPCILLEAHGTNRGIECPDGSTYKWDTFIARIRDINIASSNTCYVLLATCYSFEGLVPLMFDITQPVPAYSVMAARGEAKLEDLRRDFCRILECLYSSDTVVLKDFAVQAVSSIHVEVTLCKLISSQMTTRQQRDARCNDILTQVLQKHGSCSNDINKYRRHIKNTLRGDSIIQLAFNELYTYLMLGSCQSRIRFEPIFRLFLVNLLTKVHTIIIIYP